MPIDLKLLETTCKIPGPAGFEHQIREFIKTQIKDHVDEFYTDHIGNLVVVKKSRRFPNQKRVMVAAHMDEIGFIITHIDDNGFLKFHTLGGFDPKTLTAQRVIVHGKKDLIGVMGSKPIHIMPQEERNKMPKISEFYIDLGRDKEEVDKLVQIGDYVTREREFVVMGSCVNCKSIDNRVSVFILMETLRNLKDPAFDVYGVFTVQEEVGLRGANVAAQHVEPDFGLALDTTIAYDVPGAQPHEKITSLGKGPAIKIMDASVICDTRMVSFLKNTADRHGISWQPEILTAGGTDTAGVQTRGKHGSIAGAISIPTRNLHQVIEMAHSYDIEKSIELLGYSLTEMDYLVTD